MNKEYYKNVSYDTEREPTKEVYKEYQRIFNVFNWYDVSYLLFCVYGYFGTLRRLQEVM